MIPEAFKNILQHRLRMNYNPTDLELAYMDDTVVINMVSTRFIGIPNNTRVDMVLPILKSLEEVFKHKYKWQVGLYTPGERT